MKRIMCCAFLIVLLSIIPSYGSSKDIGTAVMDIPLVLDGELLKPDVPPYYDNGVLMVPARFISNLLGADFVIEKKDFTKIIITTADNLVEMKIGNNHADINNGVIISMKSAPVVSGQEVMMPLESLSFALGMESRYSERDNVIYLDYFSRMSGDILIGGSATLFNVTQRVIDALRKMNPGFHAILIGGGSTAGVKSCEYRELDIANVSRNLEANEAYYYSDLVRYRIALEGIAVIVNKANPVNSMTMEQVFNIFTGKSISWKDVGGDDLPIFVNVQEAGSGVFSSFYDIVIGDARLDIVSTALPNSSNGIERQAVASELKSIGFVSFPFLDDTVKVVKLNGNDASGDNVINNKWPYYNSLNVFTKGKASGLTAKYINYLHSPKGRKILQEEGFINLPNYYGYDRF